MKPPDKREEILEYLRRVLRERPKAALILAEILGPPPSLREGPWALDPEESQSK